MKNIIFLFVFLSSLQLIAQQYVVTPSGLRNAKNLEKEYVVIEVEGVSAKQLYENSIKYIIENYKNPEKALKAATEGEFLKFHTNKSSFESLNFIIHTDSSGEVPIWPNYTTELRFKEGRVRYEIKKLGMAAPPPFFGAKFSPHQNYASPENITVYNKNGKLSREKAKVDIESYFNNTVSRLSKFLSGEDDSTDDW